MIKNLIFDFGDVFINLDKQAVKRELESQNLTLLENDTIRLLNNNFEIGAVSTDEFVAQMGVFYPTLKSEEIKRIWNAILLDFPDARLAFLEALAASKEYRLFLLSNTNAIHISKVKEIMGHANFERFENCFEQFYLSHEIQLRKPNSNCYEFVLRENGLNARETLFIDDSSLNTEAAAKLAIQVWNLQVGKEDVMDLKSRL